MNTSTIYIKVGQHFRAVALEDIHWVQAEGNHSLVFTATQQYIVKQSLRTLTTKVLPDQFQQVHRQYVVNLQKVDVINPPQNVLKIGDRVLPIGASYKKPLQNAIEVLP